MRNISINALQAMLASETDEIFLFTLKISHSSLEDDLLFVNDTQDLERSDGTYQAFPFQVVLPEDSDESNLNMSVVIDNVDQQVIQIIRNLSTSPTIEISVVLKSSPNTIEAGPFEMRLKDVDYDALTISGTVGYDEDFLNEPFPAHQFTPQTTPNLF